MRAKEQRGSTGWVIHEKYEPQRVGGDHSACNYGEFRCKRSCGRSMRLHAEVSVERRCQRATRSASAWQAPTHRALAVTGATLCALLASCSAGSRPKAAAALRRAPSSGVAPEVCPCRRAARRPSAIPGQPEWLGDADGCFSAHADDAANGCVELADWTDLDRSDRRGQSGRAGRCRRAEADRRWPTRQHEVALTRTTLRFSRAA